MINLFDNQQIIQAKAACRYTLPLTFNGLTVRVLADQPAILDHLEVYYAGLTASGLLPKEVHTIDQPELPVWLLDQQVDTSGREWTAVKRAKTSALGLKEAYVDTPQGRWIHKVRTGMVLFQSLTAPVAVGELNKHHSQVINFINNQFLNHHQRGGYLLGHASAFDIDGNVTAIAASSGGGKSTLMLKALETAQARFLSNDRVLFKPDNGQINILGVAKHPRVNPGTLIHSPRLIDILPAHERARFEHMPSSQLWDIEQKYDVLIPNAYGADKTALSGTLKHLVLLDWALDSTAPTALSSVDIATTPEALEGLRKSPGPFFQRADGHFPAEQAQSAQAYAEYLAGVDVLRLTGAIDFARAIELFNDRGIL
ncbi:MULTISPECIES: HprK-related kinase B [unclassified Halomonas]|uniref:HprK-related kinase B n=1 Tax=unclassified Halomonas TaxID=2609666 RepID=UPI000553FF1E|nr:MULTISPECIES: HprK-related kinase B [unclassified Halomonas]CEP36809.1 HPr kinase [Halomonas sp. R57-5]